MGIVSVEKNIKQKFIVVEMVDGQLLLRGDTSVTWHKNILENLEKDGARISKINGGGWIYPEMASRTIYVWDKSTRYGEAELSIVRDLLSAHFADFKIFNKEPDVACG